jgi:hypothetical protein
VFVDLEGHWQDTTINRALLGSPHAFSLLDSYPAASESSEASF